MTGNNAAAKVLSSQYDVVSKRASTRPEWNAAAIKALYQAVAEFDISKSTDWSKLEELSNNTVVEGIFPYSESAMFQAGHFIVPATIGVTLNYGGKSDAVQFPDSFPADIVFDLTISESKPDIKILGVNVDTRSFYV